MQNPTRPERETKQNTLADQLLSAKMLVLNHDESGLNWERTGLGPGLYLV